MNKEERAKRSVTVFGAGISGLTAAHELAVRGFDVQVIDAEYNEEWKDWETPLDRGIGGMARSQWAIAANSEIDSRSKSSGGFPLDGKWVQRLWSGADLLHEKAIDFDPQSKLPRDEKRAGGLIATLARAIRSLNATKVLSPKTITILIPVHAGQPVLADYRARYLVDELAKLGIGREDVERMIAAYPDNKRLRSTCIYFSPSGGTAAAEHGFRFFPSFYRHLFDSMHRTPILNPGASERTKATVFENLVPTDGLGLARGKQAVSFIVARRAIMSFETVRRLLREVLGELEYSASDLMRFELKLFKYLTSSTERRCREYEDLSWGTFVESDRYSEICQAHIEYGPQMTAALRGSQSDTRTQGNILIQLLLDQFKPNALADYTLSGPTSGMWLDHWYDFLCDQKVTFARGELEGFHVDKGRVRPTVHGAEPTGEFFVLALSLPQIARLTDSFLAAASEADVPAPKLHDLYKIRTFAGDLEQDLRHALPLGPLQHLSGIQFYFDEDVRFWRGHTQYLDSAWGLTSIAQPQFWARIRDPNDDYRSILSVDIGIFDRRYEDKKTAWECTADELAQYTWEQIRDHHDDIFKKKYGPHAPFPTPSAYALDGKLFFPDRNGRSKRNLSPFLVNRTGKYKTRPGSIITTKGKSKTLSLYDVITNESGADARWGYVLAGTFMQTFTRLTSMESANESARHAVNALLQFWRVEGDRCDIWDPEDYELDDLQWFKDLDEELLGRELPHFVDILGWSELPEQIVPHQLHSLMHMISDRSKGGSTK